VKVELALLLACGCVTRPLAPDGDDLAQQQQQSDLATLSDLAAACPPSIEGFYADLSGNTKVQAGYLIAEPITIPCPTTVSALGILTRASGGQVSIGLYDTDTADPANPFPGNRLAYTNDQSIASVGRNEFPVTRATVAPGDYFIATIYSTTTQVAASTQQGTMVGIEIASPKPATTELPQTFPTPTNKQVGRALNYYTLP
jgi:hypothetical protein